jgi:Xaa-Pro aminopeptidase
LCPGIKFKDVYIIAATAIVDGLKQLGLMQGDSREAVMAGAHALFFPHGLGHMMGLDVHDMENLGEKWVGYGDEPRSTQFGLASLRLARTLEAGFVLTIEPGIYFIPELIDQWKAEKRLAQFIRYDVAETYKNFGGIRNEEDYLITSDGARRLGPALPLSADEMEEARNY